MASPAQTYFDSFPPAEQQRIRASWAGNPNGMQDWFNAAVGAGAVGSDGNPRDPNAGAGSDYAAQTGHTQGQSQGVSGSSGLKQGQTPSPAQLRQYAKENNWPEDFDRFNDATLQSWISNNWNPKTMMFTSEKGVPGDVYKPVDVPEGYTAWGQGAIKTSQLPAWAGGGGGNGQAPQGAPEAGSPAAAAAGPPGQSDLINMLKTKGGYFSQFGAPTSATSLSGGGLMWTDQAANSGPAGAANPGAAALVSATLNAFSPQAPSKQPQNTGAAPAPAPAGGFSDPYETWKAQGSPGTFSDWQGQQSAGQPAQVSAQPASRPVTADWLSSGIAGTQGPGGFSPTPAAPAAAPQATGAQALTSALTRRYADPNQWWKGSGVASGVQQAYA